MLKSRALALSLLLLLACLPVMAQAYTPFNVAMPRRRAGGLLSRSDALHPRRARPPVDRRSGALGTKAVTYAQRTALGCPVNVITVDLNDSRIRVTAAITSGGIGSDEPFASFIRRTQPTAAINGTFFSKRNLRPIGDIVVDGQLVHFGAMGTGICFTNDCRAQVVSVVRHSHTDWSDFRTVMCRGPRLLRNGTVCVDAASEGFRDPHALGRANRAGVGVTAGNKLIMANTSKGLTLSEWANVMKALGCVDAINLDGGASVAMYYRGKTISQAGRRLTNVLLIYEKD